MASLHIILYQQAGSDIVCDTCGWNKALNKILNANSIFYANWTKHKMVHCSNWQNYLHIQNGTTNEQNSSRTLRTIVIRTQRCI